MPTVDEQLIEKLATELNRTVEEVQVVWKQVLVNHPLKLFKAPERADFDHSMMRSYFDFIKEAVEYYNTQLASLDPELAFDQYQHWGIINTYIENYYVDWMRDRDCLTKNENHFNAFILVDSEGNALKEQLGYLESFATEQLNKTEPLSTIDILRFLSLNFYSRFADLHQREKSPIAGYGLIRSYSQIVYSNELNTTDIFKKAIASNKPLTIYIQLPNQAWCQCRYENGSLKFNSGRYAIPPQQLTTLTGKLKLLFNKQNITIEQTQTSQSKTALIYSGFDLFSEPHKIPGEQEASVIQDLMRAPLHKSWQNLEHSPHAQNLDLTRLSSIIFAKYFLYSLQRMSDLSTKLATGEWQLRDLHLLQGGSIYDEVDALAKRGKCAALFLSNKQFTQPQIEAFQAITPVSNWLLPIQTWEKSNTPVPTDEKNKKKLTDALSNQHRYPITKKTYDQLSKTNDRDTLIAYIAPLNELRHPFYRFIFERTGHKCNTIEQLSLAQLQKLCAKIAADWDTYPDKNKKDCYDHLSLGKLVTSSFDLLKERLHFIWDVAFQDDAAKTEALCKERYYLSLYSNTIGGFIKQKNFNPNERPLDRLAAVNFINYLKSSLLNQEIILSCSITDLRFKTEEISACLAFFDHNPRLLHILFKIDDAASALEHALFHETKDDHYLYKILCSHPVQKTLARNRWLGQNNHIDIRGQAAIDHWGACAKYALTYLNNNPCLLSSHANHANAHENFKQLIGFMGVSYLNACFRYLQDHQTNVEMMLGDKRPDFLIGAYEPIEGSLDAWIEAEKIHFYTQLNAFLRDHFATLQANRQENKMAFFPFARLILPYSTVMTANDYAHFFEQASLAYPDLDAFVLDIGENFDSEHGFSILQAIDTLLNTGLKPTTLLSIPCLEDDALFKPSIASCDYFRLRALYRDINHRILTERRQKNTQQLLMQTKVIPTTHPINQATKTTLPFRRKQGHEQHGLEYQYQMTFQQQKQQETTQDNDDVLSSRLVTSNNILQFPKIRQRAEELGIALDTLPTLFLQWVGLKPYETSKRFAFSQMTERAFIMLLEHQQLFKDGLHASNLPQGFHQLEDNCKQWVLDYQPLKQRVRAADEFTIGFHTKKDSSPLLGHYRDFLVSQQKPKAITQEALTASLLFSALASKAQNEQAFIIVQNELNGNGLNPAYKAYGWAIVQLYEDFGFDAINYLAQSNVLNDFDPLGAWIRFLEKHNPDIAWAFAQQNYTASDLAGFGQVYQHYGMEGVCQLIQLFAQLSTYNAAFFAVLKADIINTSNNFCEFLDPTSGVQNVLQEIMRCHQMNLWLAILKQHSVALNDLDAQEMVALWKAFRVFQEKLLVLNVSFDAENIPKNTNMLLWMGKALEILTNLPVNERQAHLNNLCIVDNLRHGGLYYELLYGEKSIQPSAPTHASTIEEQTDDSSLIPQELSDRLNAHKSSSNQLEKLTQLLTSHSQSFTASELRFRAELLAPLSQNLDYPIGFLSHLLQQETNNGHLSDSTLLQLNERLFNHKHLNRLEQLQVLPLLLIDGAQWMDSLALLDNIPSYHQSAYLNGLEKIKTADELQDYLLCYDTLFNSDFCTQQPDLLQDWLNALNNPNKQANAIALLKQINTKPKNKDELLAIIGRLYAAPVLIGQASSNESYRKCNKLITKQYNSNLEQLAAICADYPILTADTVYRFLKQSGTYPPILNNQEALEMVLLTFIENEQPRRDYDGESRQADYDRIVAGIVAKNPAIKEDKLHEAYQQFQTIRASLALHNKPLSLLRQTLQETIDHFKTTDDPTQRLNDEYTVLAIVHETMYRSTGKYPKLTQQLSAVIRTYLPAKPHIFDMDTGEGKAICMHTATALDVLLHDKTVDIIHYKRNLVQRDVSEFKDFYQKLGIKAGAATAGKPRDLTLQVHNGTLSDIRLSEHLSTITTGEKTPQSIRRCAKIDESDVLHSLEAHMQHKLAIPGPYAASEMAWFYEVINTFYDENIDNVFDTNGYVLLDAAQNLSRQLFEAAKDDATRLAIVRLYAPTQEKQALWLVAACDAYHLKQNTDFILTPPEQCLNRDDINFCRYMIPIDATTKEPVDGMSFSDGVQQLKATRINQDAVSNGEVPVYIPVQSALLSTNVGEGILSTYQGDIEEYSATPLLKENTQHTVLHMPTNYPSLRSYQGYQVVNQDEYVHTLAEKIRTAFKERRSILISCENNSQSIELYNQVQALFSDEERDYLMCFTQEQQTADNFLAHKKAKEKQGHATAVFSATLGRGDNPDVETTLITYVPRTTAEYWQISGRTARHGNKGEVAFLLNADNIQAEINHLQLQLSLSQSQTQPDALLSELLTLRQSHATWRATSEAYPYQRLISDYSDWQLQLFGQYLLIMRDSKSSITQSYEEDASKLLRTLQTRLDDINNCWDSLQGTDNAYENIQSVVMKHAQNTRKLFETYLKNDLPPFKLSVVETNLVTPTLLSMNDLEPRQAPVEQETKRRALNIELPFWEKSLIDEDQNRLRQAVTSIVDNPVLFALWPKLSALTNRWLNKAKHLEIIAFWQNLSIFAQTHPNQTIHLANFLPTLLAQSGKLQFELFLSLMPVLLRNDMEHDWCDLDNAYFDKLKQALANPVFSEQHTAAKLKAKKELPPLFALLAQRLRLQTPVNFEHYVFFLQDMKTDYLATLLAETTGITSEHARLCVKDAPSAQDIALIEISRRERDFYQMVDSHLSHSEEPSQAYCTWVQTMITNIVNVSIAQGYLSFLSTVFDTSTPTTAIFQQSPDELELTLLLGAWNHPLVIQAIQDNKEALVNNREQFKAILRIINDGQWQAETSALVAALLTLSIENINRLAPLLIRPELQNNPQPRQKIIWVLNNPQCLHKRLERLYNWTEEPLSKQLFFLEKGIPPALQIQELSAAWDGYEKIESHVSIADLNQLDCFILKHRVPFLNQVSIDINHLSVVLDCIKTTTPAQQQLKSRLFNQLIAHLDTKRHEHEYQGYLKAILLSYEALSQRGMTVNEALALLTSDIHDKVYALYQACHTFNEHNTADLLYLLLMRLQQNTLSDEAFNELIASVNSSITTHQHHGLTSVQHRLANQTAQFSLEQAHFQPKEIIYTAATALESNTWRNYFQLTNQWQLSRPIRMSIMRMIGQDSMLPIANISRSETLSFWQGLWTQAKTGDFIEHVFQQYHHYLQEKIVTFDVTFQRPVTKQSLQYYGFFSGEQSKTLCQHAKEIKHATEHSNHLLAQTSFQHTSNLVSLQAKLLECIDAYHGFFSINLSRRRQRNEIENYIRTYLSQTSFNEHPYIHLMNYLADKLVDVQTLDQTKAHQLSFHKKGHSRLSNMIKTMQDHVVACGLQETNYNQRAFQEQLSSFADKSTVTFNAVLETLKLTLSHWRPIKGQDAINQAIKTCQDVLQQNTRDESLQTALEALNKELVTDNLPANIGKLQHCVLQALHYCEITSQSQTIISPR